MNIVSTTKFLEHLNMSNIVNLSYKYDDKLRRIVVLAFMNEHGEKFACQFPKEETSSLYNIIFETLQQSKTVYLYDLKKFLKLFFSHQSTYIYNIDVRGIFRDVLIELYDEFNKHITLQDEFIEKLTSKRIRVNDTHEFYRRTSETLSFPYQIFSFDEILRECLDEIEIIDCIRKTLQFVPNKFKTVLYDSSETYAVIETNQVYVNNCVERIDKYFDNIDSSIGNVVYNFTKTRTGRLESKFHLISKENAQKVLVSRFQRGEILYCDMKNFEIRSMLEMWGEECNEVDVYKIEEYDRELVKKNVISWLYGSTSFHKKVIESFIKKYPNVEQKRADIVNSNASELTTILGKRIKYDSNEEYKRKCINNLVQNYAAFLMMEFTTNLNMIMTSKNVKSKIIATKFDEIILDCHEDETDFISKAINFCLKKISGRVLFLATTHSEN